jgi:hypothetical protein
LIDVGEWLSSRAPGPPPELSSRLAALVGDAQVADVTAMADLFVAQAVTLLENLSDDRSAATDLLVADALITYAMEAAADDHDSFESVAGKVMDMVARVSSDGGEG